MNKLKLFLDNLLIYGLGGIIGKIIPLLMVPIITRLIPDTSYYGISDLSNTLVSLTSSIAVLGMYDAVYRIFFDKEDLHYKKKVCSTAFSFTIMTSICIFLLMILFRHLLAEKFFTDNKYLSLVYISAVSTLAGATNTIVSAPTRMQNKRKQFLIVNTFGPVISYTIAIVFLMQGFHLIALPVGAMISSISGEIIYYFLNKSWFDFKLFDKSILLELLKLAIPLFPNFIIYWVFNSCDRLMIANMMGTAASGIYTVGAKLGNCSQLIYTAFAGGWQFFAFSTMREKNQVESNSKIFEYMGVLSFAAGILVCAWSYSIYQMLFVGNYQAGYIAAPYLFFAPLIQMLEQIIGNQFLVIKKAWPTTLILSCGALVNIVFNYCFIPLMGIEGAAIATLLGYITALIVCSLVLIKMRLFVISKRFLFVCTAVIGYVFIWRVLLTKQTLVSTVLALIIIIFEIILYRQDISVLLTKFKSARVKGGV